MTCKNYLKNDDGDDVEVNKYECENEKECLNIGRRKCDSNVNCYGIFWNKKSGVLKFCNNLEVTKNNENEMHVIMKSSKCKY